MRGAFPAAGKRSPTWSDMAASLPNESDDLLIQTSVRVTGRAARNEVLGTE
jgi:hypothetical protein